MWFVIADEVRIRKSTEARDRRQRLIVGNKKLGDGIVGLLIRLMDSISRLVDHMNQLLR
jgi:hypothetical protein